MHEKITEYGEKLAEMKDRRASVEEKEAFIKKAVKEIEEYIYGNQKELRIISEPGKTNADVTAKPEQQSIKTEPSETGKEGDLKLETSEELKPAKELTPEEIKQAEIS